MMEGYLKQWAYNVYKGFTDCDKLVINNYDQSEYSDRDIILTNYDCGREDTIFDPVLLEEIAEVILRHFNLRVK